MISRCSRPKKPQREAKAERRRTLHLIGKARIVQPQPSDRGAQIFEFRRIDRKQPAEDDGLRRLEARQRFGAGLFLVGDRVADAGVGDLLDLRRDEADLAGAEFAGIDHFRPEDADAVDLIMGVRPPSS